MLVYEFIILVFVKLGKEKWRRKQKREVFLRRAHFHIDRAPYFREENFISPEFDEDWSEDAPEMEDPIYDSVPSITSVTLHPEPMSRERESVI